MVLRARDEGRDLAEVFDLAFLTVDGTGLVDRALADDPGAQGSAGRLRRIRHPTTVARRAGTGARATTYALPAYDRPSMTSVVLPVTPVIVGLGVMKPLTWGTAAWGA